MTVIYTQRTKLDIVKLAIALAKKAHEGQTRKYIGVPYITHPARVAARVLCTEWGDRDYIVAAAWMHDILEDTELTHFDLWKIDEEAADIVKELTNIKDETLSRAEQKKADRERLANTSYDAQLIKIFDRIDNLKDMEFAPLNFKRLYAEESILLFEAIGNRWKTYRDEGLDLCAAIINKIDEEKERNEIVRNSI